MRTVYAPTGGRAIVERGTPALGAPGDARPPTSSSRPRPRPTRPTRELRGPLLELFESLKAEALVIVLEGRRVDRPLRPRARGARAPSTRPTTTTAFRAIYGKLFVIAYYLKNIARESIMTTVDREIALSDQIIRFALEKVDRIEHPKADASWIARSARSLGGDFIDFVRLSQDRWFIVMGDVSGKGLSASMNMLILKSMIRTFLRVEKDFVGLVSQGQRLHQGEPAQGHLLRRGLRLPRPVQGRLLLHQLRRAHDLAVLARASTPSSRSRARAGSWASSRTSRPT